MTADSPPDELLRNAVANNAAWCGLVCGLAGVPSTADEDVWRAGADPPPYFPQLVTLTPAGLAGTASSVKDSFARLSPVGLGLLVEGRWLAHAPVAAQAGWRVAASTVDLAAWAAGAGDALSPALLGGLVGAEDVAVLLADDGAAGCTANLAHGVVGVTNVWGDRWGEVAGAVATRWPGRPVVGWEAVDDLAGPLAAGFVELGPLRVWVRR